jgi:hypothetical protein
MDSSGRPIPVSSVDDDPPGFPFTCNSELELRQLFPGAEFVFLTPKSNNTVVRRDADVEKQALALMQKEGIATPPTPTRTVAVAAATAAPLPGAESSHRQKAEEFLKRLQTALEYTSKKHEKKLQAQVEIIEALIKEIF